MQQRTAKRPIFLSGALIVLLGLVAACSGGVPQSGGVSQKDVDEVNAKLQAREQEVAKLQTQIKGQAGPSTLVQAGQLQPAPAAAQPSGWDTPESIRGNLKVFAKYDSSGPPAWDAKTHPLVYFTSEGPGYGHRPSTSNKLGGVQVIDATTKRVITSALFDLGEEVTAQPHGLGVSPDGKWIYIGFADRVKATGLARNNTLIINAQTLKLDTVLSHPTQRLHHVMGFKDWQGRDRVVLEYGFGSNGGPHFIVDPNENNRVLRAITEDDTKVKMGHPFLTVDPTGKFLYVSVVAPEWRDKLHNTAGIAKLDMEKGTWTVIPYVGDHPIGVAHTADGKFTYVNDGHGSYVYKIDNATNKVVASTSAGVAGPYGLALNWNETQIWVVGKGEGSHNTGGVLGVIDTKLFSPDRTFNQPVNIAGSIIDHAILHPDPKVNELWVSSAGTWETIVVDLNTKEVKARIPSPNGGDTHSGAFVRYAADWAGEVLADHGGPQKAMYDLKRPLIAAVQ